MIFSIRQTSHFSRRFNHVSILTLQFNSLIQCWTKTIVFRDCQSVDLSFFIFIFVLLLQNNVTLHARDHCRSRVNTSFWLKAYAVKLSTVLETGTFYSNKPFFLPAPFPHFKHSPYHFFEITRQISLVNIDDLFNYFVKLIHTSSKCQDLSRYDPRLSGLKSGPIRRTMKWSQNNRISWLPQFYKQLYINWWSNTNHSPACTYLVFYQKK